MRALAPLLTILTLAPLPALARCLEHEPSVVTLVGELASRTLPGPPNYRNIARGDMPETVLILRLEQPVCVSGDPTSSLKSKTHAGVTEVQLALPLEDAKAYVGKRVRVTGSLFDAHSGHHRTPVVLRVSALRTARLQTDPGSSTRAGHARAWQPWTPAPSIGHG